MAIVRKRRVLFVGEASFLATGFSTYTNEVLKRLHATGEFAIGEIGCYGHDDDPRCQQVPWKFYPVAPSRNNQQAMQIYSSKPTNQFGELKIDDVCLDFKPDIVVDHRDFWMCFASGTLIVLADGSVKPIQNISLQDSVLTHNGNIHNVINVFRKKYSGDLYTIKASNLTIPITMTSEHPVLVINRHKQHSLNQQWSKNKPSWKSAREITKDDFLCLPIAKNIIDDSRYSIDLCRLIGYYLAQGCLLYQGRRANGRVKGIQLTFNHKAINYIEDIRQLIMTYFSVDAKIHRRENCSVIRAYGEKIGKFFLSHCNEHARNKKITKQLYQLPNEKITGLLCGLTRGDGCLNNRRGSYNTISKNLAYQTFMLFCRLGIVPSMSYNKNPTGKGPGDHYRYIMGISAKSLDGFKQVYNDCCSPTERDTTRSNNDYIFLTVKDITIKSVKEHDVYNFEVAKDNSYVTSFAVHNCEFIDRSAFRQNFVFLAMPTIDGEPQRELWLDMYKRCDGVLTYSKYGMDLLKRTGRPETKLITIATPGVDLDVFKPPDNKRDHKAKLGIDPNAILIGMTARNQKRKLYYDLIEAYAKWLHKSKAKGHLELAKRTFLYLHTSYPDVGYDIGKAIKDFKVGNRVIMTYLCGNCNTAYPAFFSGELTTCRKCGAMAAHPPNAGHSCPRTVLADIMKTFDLHVQYAICEGAGMPALEAMACGVPVAAMPYSAMEDYFQCPTSIPIRIERFFWEAIIETEQRRALPDNQDFANKLDRFLKQSETQRIEQSQKTRAYATELVDTYGQTQKMQRYSWDRTAAIWGQVIREIKIKDPQTTWFSPESRIHQPNLTPPKQDMNNTEFVRWVISHIWQRPDMARTHFAGEWTKALNSGARTQGDKRVPFDRQQLVQYFLQELTKRNQSEQKRLAKIKPMDNDQINAVVI